MAGEIGINLEEMMAALTEAGVTIPEGAIGDDFFNNFLSIVEAPEVTGDVAGDVVIDDESIDDPMVAKAIGKKGTGYVDPFAGLDVNSMTENEKVLYNGMKIEQKRSLEREQSLLISHSGLGDKEKSLLKKMGQKGMDIEDLEEAIADFKELNQSKVRTLGGRGVHVPQSKVKVISKDTSPKMPKFGTREYGASLVKNIKK